MATAFRAALARCGFEIPQRNAVTTYGGFDDIGEIANVTEEDISKLAYTIKKEGITFPTMIEKKLQAIRYWSKDNDRFGLATDPTDLTSDVCNGYLALKAKHDKNAKRTQDMDKTKPTGLKDPKNWRKFEGKFKEFLTKHLGEQGIPLSYLIRSEETPDPGTIYDTVEIERELTVPLAGDDFDDENKVLMGLIKELTIDGPAWNHIKQFEKAGHGRKAFVKMRDVYMGGGANDAIVSQAEGLLTRLRYTGEKKNFTIEKFLEKVSGAFNDIELHSDQVYTETTRVKKLLGMIQCPTLEATKVTIKAHLKYKDDFDESQNLILSTVLDQRIEDLNRRHISGLVTKGRGDGRGRGRGGRGRGGGPKGGRWNENKGGGRGNYPNNSGYRGYQGRGNYHPNNQERGHFPGRGGGGGHWGNNWNRNGHGRGDASHTQRIPDAEWNKMSFYDRKQVHLARSASSVTNGEPNPNPNGQGTPIDNQTATSELTEDDTQGNPLSQFGQGSKRKRNA